MAAFKNTEELIKSIEADNKNITIPIDDNKVILPHIDIDKSNQELIDNNSNATPSVNKVLDIIELNNALKENADITKTKVFSWWNRFKHKLNSRVREKLKMPATIRLMVKSDYTIYPMDMPIEGKTVSFKNRKYKLDGYEHRLYELEGIVCIFVDVNDARLLELSHKYANPAYDAREFSSLLESKAYTELLSGNNEKEKLDKIYILVLIGLGLTALVAAMMWGFIKPDWQKIIAGLQFAAQAAQTVVQNTGTAPAQIITGR